MSTAIDLVALTLLPLWRWRTVAEQLRAGHLPAALLEQHCDEWTCLPQPKPACPGVDVLRSRAAAALERAGRQHIELVSWSDATYPAVLTAIVDPPPVLWVRGLLSTFDRPSVAIVGSRRGSPYALAAA